MSTIAQITWAPLARSLALEIAGSAVRPAYAAIAGAQGSGKTTLAGLLNGELRRLGVRAVACSLDDFYLERDRRVALSKTAHPLLITRGVPGTHDVDLCLRVLDEVTRGPTAMPQFDKGLDDRLDASRWTIAGPVDVVVIEGWCLGARAQGAADLVAPVNDLERDEDPDGRWRCLVNDALAGRYQALFARFHKLVFLQVPGIDAVRRWRAEQENELPQDRQMTVAQLQRFIAHYERLTSWMIEDVPGRADLTVVLDDAHRIERLVTKPAP